jgi:heptosyltransferase I
VSREAPQRILVIRLSAIGDVIMASSLLPGLRARYPEARITWLTEGLGAELLADHPHLDAVWVLPRKEWRTLRRAGRWGAFLRGLADTRRRLREARFDLVIDLQGLLKSALWAWVSGAPRRVSLRGREHSSWLMTETVADPAGMGGPLCREYRLMAAHLGLPAGAFAMDLHPLPEKRAVAAELLRPREARPVFLFPFTTRPQKHWFEERWSALAARLGELSGHRVWILGGPGDEAAAHRIAKGAGGQVGVIAGPATDLRDKVALVAEAALSIGVDTGLTHLSLGLGRPTVALFGSTCPYQETSPVPGIVLYDRRDCSPCRRHPTCAGAFTCMRDHSVERVLTAARQLLTASAG